jgi:hypothetical protein
MRGTFAHTSTCFAIRIISSHAGAADLTGVAPLAPIDQSSAVSIYMSCAMMHIVSTVDIACVNFQEAFIHRVTAMTTRESVNVQLAGADGEPVCAPSHEALLVHVPSRAGTGDYASSTDVIDDGRTKDAAVIGVPTAAVRHESTRGDTPHSVSLSVPASPSGLHLAQVGMPPRSSVRGVGAVPPNEMTVDVHHPTVPQLLKQARHHSQPSLVATRGACGEAPAAVPRSDSTRERDRRFDHFKTFSGRLERQLSALRGLPQDPLPSADDIEQGGSASKISEEDTDEDDDVPSADRYFAALEGPELETLRVRTTT